MPSSLNRIPANNSNSAPTNVPASPTNDLEGRSVTSVDLRNIEIALSETKNNRNIVPIAFWKTVIATAAVAGVILALCLLPPIPMIPIFACVFVLSAVAIPTARKLVDPVGDGLSSSSCPPWVISTIAIITLTVPILVVYEASTRESRLEKMLESSRPRSISV